MNLSQVCLFYIESYCTHCTTVVVNLTLYHINNFFFTKCDRDRQINKEIASIRLLKQVNHSHKMNASMSFFSYKFSSYVVLILTGEWHVNDSSPHTYSNSLKLANSISICTLDINKL